MTLYTCEFPLPPRACSPNVMSGSIGSRMRESSAVKQYRATCCMIARAAASENRLPKCAEKAIIHLSFYYGPGPNCIARDGRYRALDAANALTSFKAGIDSLVDAGVLVADDHRHLSIGRVELYRRAEEHRGRCCVEVTLEVME